MASFDKHAPRSWCLCSELTNSPVCPRASVGIGPEAEQQSTCRGPCPGPGPQPPTTSRVALHPAARVRRGEVQRLALGCAQGCWLISLSSHRVRRPGAGRGEDKGSLLPCPVW